MGDFEELVREASEASVATWDFSYIEGRYEQDPPSWDWHAEVGAACEGAGSLLDLGTGDGRLLASIRPWPPRVSATEGHPPMVPIARARLEPLGAEVVPISEDEKVDLPFGDARFDVVYSAREFYRADEVARILEIGGVFLTEQVTSGNLNELNRFLDETDAYRDAPDAEAAAAELRDGGFEVLDLRDEWLDARFLDVGAIVFYLRLVIWQLPGFTVGRYRDRLRALHETIEREGVFRARSRRFFLKARKLGP